MLNLKSKFKTGISYAVRLLMKDSYFSSLNVPLPEYEKPKELPDEWIAGFVESDGSFNISTSIDKGRRIQTRIFPEFSVVQHEKDLHILELISKRFDVGRISRRSDENNMFRYRVSNLQDNVNTIIPFFNKHINNYGKSLDFVLWSDVLDMMTKKNHLTEDGLKIILEKIEFIRRNRI